MSDHIGPVFDNSPITHSKSTAIIKLD